MSSGLHVQRASDLIVISDAANRASSIHTPRCGTGGSRTITHHLPTSLRAFVARRKGEGLPQLSRQQVDSGLQVTAVAGSALPLTQQTLLVSAVAAERQWFPCFLALNRGGALKASRGWAVEVRGVADGVRSWPAPLRRLARGYSCASRRTPLRTGDRLARPPPSRKGEGCDRLTSKTQRTGCESQRRSLRLGVGLAVAAGLRDCGRIGDGSFSGSAGAGSLRAGPTGGSGERGG